MVKSAYVLIIKCVHPVFVIKHWCERWKHMFGIV